MSKFGLALPPPGGLLQLESPTYLRGLDRALLASWLEPALSSSANWVTTSANATSSPSPSSTSRPCLACRCRKEAFHCQGCLNSGHFAHSDRQRVPEVFAELKSRKVEVEATLDRLRGKVEEVSLRREEKIDLRERIRQLKSRIRHAKAVKEDGQRRLDLTRKAVGDMKKHNDKRWRRMPEFRDKVDKIAKASRMQKAALRGERERCLKRGHVLAGQRRKAAKEALMWLYPVEEEEEQERNWEQHVAREMMEKEENDDDDDDDMRISECLKDAIQTSYVDGHWVSSADEVVETTTPSSGRRFKESNDDDDSREASYRVVAPRLPASGDYSVYLTWGRQQTSGDFGNLDEDDEEEQSSSSSDRRRPTSPHPAHAISAGLMFLSQACLHLSALLDVVLPAAARPRMSDFGGGDLLGASEFDFGRRVSRLNLGVFLLCLSQGVAPERLKASRAAANFYALCQLVVRPRDDPDSSSVGRIYRASTGRELLAADEAGQEVAHYIAGLPRNAEDEERQEKEEEDRCPFDEARLVHEEGWDALEDGGSALELEELRLTSPPPPPLHLQSPTTGAGSSTISEIATSFVSSFWGGGGGSA